MTRIGKASIAKLLVTIDGFGRRSAVGGLVALALSFPTHAVAQLLVETARAGGGDALLVLLTEETDATQTSGDGSTALHWASYWDDTEAAGRLIALGAEVNATNDLGATPLYAAALNGSPGMARLLLNAGADANAALLNGESLVMTAARSGNADVVRRLLEHGGSPNGRATRGQTALMWAASQQHAEVVEVLLEYGADVHARSDVWKQLWQTDGGEVVHPELHVWIDHGGSTALIFAARVGDLDSVRRLVAAGGNVNDQAAYGTSAVVFAVHSGSNALLQFLLEEGADASNADAGYSALHVALLRRNIDAVQLLLEHGADPNAVLEASTPTRRASNDFYFHPAYVGASPFWLAARFAEPEAMRLLAKHGADPHAIHHVDYWRSTAIFTGFNRDTQGATTALMAAAGMGGGRVYGMPGADDRERLMLEAVTVAADMGIDVNAANAEGVRAADAAAAAGLQSIVDFLVERGAEAPMSRAARRGPPDSTDDQ